MITNIRNIRNIRNIYANPNPYIVSPKLGFGITFDPGIGGGPTMA